MTPGDDEAPPAVAPSGPPPSDREMPDRPHIATARQTAIPAWRRAVYLPLGVLSLGLGIVGLVTPMMPGAVFLILAAWLFARSSPRFERWILVHPSYGPIVRGWRTNGAVPRKIKWVALASFVASLTAAWAAGAPPIALAVTAACLFAVAVFLVTRPDA